MHRRALLAAPLALAATPALASGGGGGGTNSYLRFPTVTATTMRSDGRRGVMTVETGVDIPDADMRHRAELSEPRIRAVFAILVQREANVLLPNGVPNVDRLARQLQSAMNIILGRRGVSTLLLGTVMIV